MIYLIQGKSFLPAQDPNDSMWCKQWIACGSADRELTERRLAQLTELTAKLDDLRQQVSGTKLLDTWHKNARSNYEAEYELLDKLNVRALDPNLDDGIGLKYELIEVPLIAEQ